MNQDLLRLILTMNTSHHDFTHNLLNVVKYIMFSSKGALTTGEIRKNVWESIQLEFTEQEINRAISLGIKKGAIVKVDSGAFLLDDNEMQAIQQKDEDAFKKVILRYIQIYKVEKFDYNDIYNMIFEYVFWYMNTNIQILLAMLQNKKMEKATEEYECTNEKREIINNFIDWNDEEKNEILYNIIAFAVDYCRMTVKKDNRSFANFFEGKKFYLDANIIFRLIGINNKERQNVTRDFVQKCKENGVNIVYTNITKYEVYTALHYSVEKLKNSADKLGVEPSKIKRIVSEHELNLDLYELYYAWALPRESFRQFDAFEDYLKNAFLKEVRDFSMEELNLPEKLNETLEEMTTDLVSYKQRLDSEANPNRENAKIDVQNLLYVRELREKKRGINAWDIKEYIISADHKYAQWSLSKYPQVAPYISLPSVWYSLFLKLNGRSGDDFKSFAEFIKLRYRQERTSVVSDILYHISSLTEERFLQDKIVDRLIESNELRVQETLDYDEGEIREMVTKAHDDVLKQAEEKGYLEGVKEGKEEGENAGVVIGMEKGKELGKEEGRKSEYQRMMETFVEKQTTSFMKFVHVVSITSWVVLVITLLCALYFLFVIILKGNSETLNPIEENLKKYSECVAILLASIGTISVLVGKGFKKWVNEEDIRGRNEKKFQKKFPEES